MSQILNTESKNNTKEELPPMLEVKGLTVEFAVRSQLFGLQSFFKAVNEVSFEINKGEILCLAGESGSGKTTVARCILRLMSPTSGSIVYNGIDILRLGGRSLINYWRDIQIIFQDPYESLNPRHDVLTIISTPIKRLTRERSESAIFEKVNKLLEEVGLDAGSVIYKLPHQMSGGQRQRVSIARALASDPKLLVADEPITMLDAEQRLSVLGLLTRLRSKRELAVLMITHDLASARVVSDRIIVMYLGQIVERGNTMDVLSHPHHPYVELICEAMPSLEHATASRSLPKFQQEATAQSRGCAFKPRCKYSTQICVDKEPKLLEISKTHYAACHNPLNEKELSSTTVVS